MIVFGYDGVWVSSLSPPPMMMTMIAAGFVSRRLMWSRCLSIELISKKSSGDGVENKFVAYAQQQNDCFRSEYIGLAADCELAIPWATEALGCVPEAVNLWIGNHLSQTSFHKDHYENLHVVVTGERHFVLLPPTDVHRMYIRSYPAAQYSYCEETGEFGLELENPVRYVPWCVLRSYRTTLCLAYQSLGVVYGDDGEGAHFDTTLLYNSIKSRR